MTQKYLFIAGKCMENSLKWYAANPKNCNENVSIAIS